jgi:stringent starvation protein B
MRGCTSFSSPSADFAQLLLIRCAVRDTRSAMVPRAADKKETLLAFLARGVAMVHLDARRPGVVVPSEFAGDPHLRLNLSYRYGIPDLDIGDERVQATLSFHGRPFQCLLPWPAVFAVTSHQTGEGQVWPEDLPTEAAQGFTAAPPERPKLAAVDGAPPRRKRAAAKEDSPADEKPPEPPDGPRRSGHLRLVR